MSPPRVLTYQQVKEAIVARFEDAYGEDRLSRRAIEAALGQAILENGFAVVGSIAESYGIWPF